MLTESRLRNFFLHLFLFTMLSLVGGRNASSETQALTLTSIAPSSGQAGTSSINLSVDGLPRGVPLGNAIVTLTPSGGGNPVTTSAFQMDKFFDIEKKVSFIVPSSISVNTPTEYTVSLSGTTATNAPLSSSNALTLTINPPPSIMLSSSSGAAGQAIEIDITGVFTRFQQGITAANFGPGISVGSGSPGGWGLLNVTNATNAKAIIKIDTVASTGSRMITVRTGAQDASTVFAVNSANEKTIQNLALASPVIVNEVNTTSSLTRYVIKSLGASHYGYAINSSGLVTGTTDNGFYNAFIYSDGKITELGTLGSFNSWGFAINDHGQVTGHSYVNINTGGGDHAFLYDEGTMFDIDTSTTMSTSVGWDINNSGQIVGEYTRSAGIRKSFIYSDGNMTSLGTFDCTGVDFCESRAFGINIFGQITGVSDGFHKEKGRFRRHAFIYSGGTVTDIGTLGTFEDTSLGCAINNLGQVTGTSTIGGSGYHAFIYSDGKMNEIGRLGDDGLTPSGINDSGQVVGYSNNQGGLQRAFLYSDGKTIDLNTLLPVGSGWELTGAYGINNSGQITGTGMYSGIGAGFILSPVVADHFSVSAPTSATSGSSFTFTVSAVDSRTSESVDPAYSGTVHFTSSDGSATLPTDVQLVNGVGTFTATLRATGNQTITATDTTKPEIAGTSGSIAVGNASQVIAGTVSIAFAGSGSGTVTSTSPNSAINCIKGSSNSCNASFPVLSLVTLSATSDWKSLFGGWSGGLVSSNNPLSFTMIEPKVVTATFTPNYKAKLLPTGTLFTSIQDAYSSVSSGSTTIQAQTYSFLEDLTFDNATDVTLNGGLNSAYNTVTGNSTIKSLTIEQGTVVLGNITVN